MALTQIDPPMKRAWLCSLFLLGSQIFGEEPPTLWSLRPIASPPAQDTTIDALITQGLTHQDLAPSPEAPPTILLRRLYFDLVGLPPTPQQAAGFSLAKLEETVDALLQSPRFGERWGKHWLDVARYAESNGRESNLTFPPRLALSRLRH